MKKIEIYLDNCGCITRDDKWIEKAKELAVLQEARKQIRLKEERIADELKELSEGESSTGGGYIYKCSTRKGNVDYKKIEILKTINLDMYRGQDIAMWKLSRSLI